MRAACTGCGEELRAAHCESCGTPAVGSRFAERVSLPAVVHWPHGCCCCRKPVVTTHRFQRTGWSLALTLWLHFAIVRTVHIPMCQACATSYGRGRRAPLVIWGSSILGICVPAALLLGPHPDEWLIGSIALVTVVLATLFAPRIARRFWAKHPGHVHGCQAATLVGRHDVILGNRAFANETRTLNDPRPPGGNESIFVF